MLRPGDTMLLFTDWLSELRTATGEVLGLDGVDEILAEHAALDPEHLLDDLVKTARGPRATRATTSPLLALRATGDG